MHISEGLSVYFCQRPEGSRLQFRYDGVRFAAEALKRKNKVGAASGSKLFLAISSFSHRIQHIHAA